jgi:predicted Zn-dependent protease
MQEHFETLADELTGLLVGQEIFTCTLAAEESDFVRLSANRVRQAGSVYQTELSVDLIEGQRHAQGQINLSGTLEQDLPRLRDLLEALRRTVRHVPPDPHLCYSTQVRSSVDRRNGQLPDPAKILGQICACGKSRDVVGIWAGGKVERGFANSLGQRNWFETASFNFDWSLYAAGDRAVKCSYAGFQWEADQLATKMEQARLQLDSMSRPPRSIAPGRYRAYLAPSALQEILAMLAWGGFGLKSHRTKQTPLIKMVEEGRQLHPCVHIAENSREGFSPRITSAGFLRPDRVALIAAGCYHDHLVGARSAREFGVPPNADEDYPDSLDMAGGRLSRDAVLAELGTGLYINNLWYCNFSDRNDCRITGMTRFACFWVQGGEIQGPVPVMRFDESVYHLLGGGLVGLTAERELIVEPDTYRRRSLASMRLPGALIEDFTLTL